MGFILTPRLRLVRMMSVLAVVTLALVTITGCRDTADKGYAQGTSSSAQASPKARVIKLMHPDYGFEVQNPAALAANSDRVFVGEVQSTAPGAEPFGYPTTVASIKVIATIRGEESPFLRARQQYGTDREGAIVMVEGDSPLRIGRAYLFATTGTENDIVPLYGNVLLKPDEVARIRESGDTSDGLLSRLRQVSPSGR